MKNSKGEQVKYFCLYHIPGIPPKNERCKTCLEDYDPQHKINNYICKHYYAYPPIRYEDIAKGLIKRGILLNNQFERMFLREIELMNIGIIKKVLEGREPPKINHEKIIDDLLNHEKTTSFAS